MLELGVACLGFKAPAELLCSLCKASGMLQHNTYAQQCYQQYSTCRNDA